jgi:threonine/homoserine/homoserine lactone efflux protein
MPPETLLNLTLLAAAAAWTPGPNNALVATSGALFGLRRTWPHVLGIALGYPLMVFLVALGLGGLFRASPLFSDVLRWAGAALLLYVAWKVARSGGLSLVRSEPRPFTFLEAAAFQWINPKGWAMAVAVTAQYVTAERPLGTATIIALIFIAAGVGSALTWAVAGQEITKSFSDAAMRRFNIAMGLLIAGCVLLLFIDRV